MDTKTIASAFNFPAAAAAAFGLHFGGHSAADVAANFLAGRLSPSSIPIDYSPESAEARLIDYRNEKIAAFEIDGDTMICLPQAYELFLKHLVGGLHTVYTKLKRLEIIPRVCNVEQVRALRSLGAIQPGVNRCKLISCTDFDSLYKDCTSASSRPGRPPKRSPIPFATSSSAGTNGTSSSSKKLKLNDTSGSLPSASSTVSNLFGSAMTPNLFPFFPLTPQQLMMSQVSQMMTSNAALSKHFSAIDGSATTAANTNGHAKLDSNDTDDEDINDGSIGSEHETSSSLYRHTRDQQSHDEDDQGESSTALNLSKGAAKTNNQWAKTGHVDEDEEVKKFSRRAVEVKDDLSDFSDDLDLERNDEDTDDHLASKRPFATKDGSSIPNVTANLFNPNCHSSVESLLLNVVGLLEVAIASTRYQEQQLKKETSTVVYRRTSKEDFHSKRAVISLGALHVLYEQEKSLRQKADSQLQQEQRLKGIYLKRWRKAQKSRVILERQLTKAASLVPINSASSGSANSQTPSCSYKQTQTECDPI